MTRLIGGMRGFVPIPADGPYRPTEWPSWAKLWDIEKSGSHQGHALYADAGPELDAVLWENVVNKRAWHARKGMRFSSEPAAAMHVMDAMRGFGIMIHTVDQGLHRVGFGFDDWVDPFTLERFARSYDFTVALALAALVQTGALGEQLRSWHWTRVGLPDISRRELLNAPLVPDRAGYHLWERNQAPND